MCTNNASSSGESAECSVSSEMLHPQSAAELQHNLLLILTASNLALLVLVGLIVRRLEGLHVKLSRFVKSSRQFPSQKPSSVSLSGLPKNTEPLPASRPPSPDLTRDLVLGHVHMLQKTLSNESLRSSFSADDFASLQCMLGDEDGVTM